MNEPGLEFLIYLISKETVVCPEPSQLFRADSYATKVQRIYLNFYASGFQILHKVGRSSVSL